MPPSSRMSEMTLRMKCESSATTARGDEPTAMSGPRYRPRPKPETAPGTAPEPTPYLSRH
jgi:hypothetical protein